MRYLRVILSILLWCLVLAGPALADRFQASYSSGEITSSEQVYTSESYVTALIIYTDGTNNATVALYDTADADTTNDPLIWASSIVAGTDGYGGRTWTFPVRAANGLYLTISGTGASAIVEYIK